MYGVVESKGSTYTQTRQGLSKAYRSINLTSFLIKNMEWIGDTMIKNKIPNESLKFKQLAYVKGISVEIALHEIVQYMNKLLATRISYLGQRSLTKEVFETVCYANDVIILLRGTTNLLSKRTGLVLKTV